MRKGDPAVRGVILTGAGDKAFIAGADIGDTRASDRDRRRAVQPLRTAGASISIENLGKPVVAAINGFALGGGCETAMACTIRIAVEHAKFGQPEVKLGLLPGGGGARSGCPAHRQGPRALSSSCRAESSARRRRTASGWSTRVVPASDLIPRAEAILNEIAANAPIAVKYALDATNKGMETSQSEGLALEALLFRAVRGHGRQEGRHLGLPREACTAVSRSLRLQPIQSNSGAINGKRKHLLRPEGCRPVRASSRQPGAAVILSDFGADVIKVEPPQRRSRGDTGTKTPIQPQSEDAYQWHLANRNKRSIALDLKSQGAQQVVFELVNWADVFIVNTPHHARKKLKLEYDDVAGWNPRLIYADLTGFGENGPDANLPGFDITAYWARSGLLSMTRDAGAPPTWPVSGSGDNATRRRSLFGDRRPPCTGASAPARARTSRRRCLPRACGRRAFPSRRLSPAPSFLRCTTARIRPTRR